MTTLKKSDQVLSMAYPTVLFLLTLSVSGYFSLIGADPHHDGIMFKPAMDVASGQMLFRDTFTGYGALSTLLQAASLIVFGKYLVTIKLLTAFFYALVSVLLYLISAKLVSKTLAFITGIMWIFMAPYFVWVFFPWSSVYALFFQLLGAYFLIISLGRNSQGLLLLSGVATSLTFWCRQPVGLLMLIAVFLFFVCLYFLRQISLKQLRNNVTVFVFGNFLVSLVFVSWLLANHALHDWWLQSIVGAYSWNETYGSGFSFVRVVGSLLVATSEARTSSLVWVLLPLSTITLLVVHSMRLLRKPRFKRRSTIILFLCFIGLASWAQYYPFPCNNHVYWGGTPMFCLFTLLILQLVDWSLKGIVGKAKATTAMISLVAVVTILFGFQPDLAIYAHKGVVKMRSQYYSMDQPRVLRYMHLSEEQMGKYGYVYSEIESFLKANPQGNVVNLTKDALYLTFDPRIRNVHQMYVDLDFADSIYPDYYRKTFSYIWENQPLILTIHPIDQSLIPTDYVQIADPDKKSDILFYRPRPEVHN